MKRGKNCYALELASFIQNSPLETAQKIGRSCAKNERIISYVEFHFDKGPVRSHRKGFHATSLD